MEIELYVMINNYLKKEILYALPNSHRTLITSVIRKLLASSSMAVAETFKRNKKMDELKSIFTYKTEEQHKLHFNSIMEEIAEYDSQFEYDNRKIITASYGSEWK